MGGWVILFGKNLFSKPSTVIKDNWDFVEIHTRLLTRCKICFNLGLFAN